LAIAKTESGIIEIRGLLGIFPSPSVPSSRALAQYFYVNRI